MTSTLEVSEKRLRENLGAIEQALRQATPGSPTHPALLAVIKADAYGHSAKLCAPMLGRAGVPWLGVTDAEEGATVRGSLGTMDGEILILSGPPGDEASAGEAARLAVEHSLTPVVWTPAQLIPLAAAARGPHPVHLELDTGMCRQGAAPGSALDAILHALAEQPRLRLDGVFTHLASAECADARQTIAQMEAFRRAVETVVAAGFRPRWVHAGNASTIDNASSAAGPTIGCLQALAASVDATAMVRCGLGLYGLCLPVEPEDDSRHAGETRLRPHLQPIATWRTTITSVQEVPMGARVGYGGGFTASRPMRLALLPVGYADGLRRSLSGTDAGGGGWVMIHGERAKIVGRVSMNLTTVDVTQIQPRPRAGDEAVLLGAGITAEDHARLAGALPYEILCGLRGNAVAV